MQTSFVLMLRSAVLVFMLSMCHCLLFGQVDHTDSLLSKKKVKPTYTSFEALTKLQDSFKNLAPKITQAHRQIKTRRELIAFQDLGTHFSPALNLQGLQEIEMGFNSGNTSLDVFKKNFLDRKYYKAAMPFTSFKYAQGGQQYIQFDGLHTQNIIPTWNLAAGIQSFSNRGYGLRQTQFHRAPFVSSHFTLPNNRFRIITSLNWIRRAGEVNGGLSQYDSISIVSPNDTSTISMAESYNQLSPGVDRNTLLPDLQGASDTIKLTNHLVQLQYHIGEKKLDPLDSILKVQPIFTLNYQFAYEKESWIYQDQVVDSSFFSNRYITANELERDSQRFIKYRHEIGISKVKRNKNGLSLGGFMGLEQGNYSHNTNLQFSTFNTYFGGEMSAILASSVAISSRAKLFVNGYNAGDYRFNAMASFTAGKWSIWSKVISQLAEPDMQQRYFTSQAFSYFNPSFSKSLSNSVLVSLLQDQKNNPFILEGKIQNLNNFIFINNQLVPEQESGSIQYLSASLAKRFSFRKFNFQLNGFAQRVSLSKIALPNWGLKLDAYYQSFVSDSNLLLKTGLDLSTHSRFMAAGYVPVLRQFNYSSAYSLGGYPLLDAYVSGEVKNLVFFFKVENVLDAFYVQRDVQSFSTYAYPMQRTAFRLGLLWDFYY